jgi:COMPASS component SWD3
LFYRWVDVSRSCIKVDLLLTRCNSRIWDTISGQCLQTILHDDNAGVVSVRFSPNGRFVLANTLDNCVRLWDYLSGNCKKTYMGHTNVKYPLGSTFGYGPPGSQGFVVSGSEDGELVFWDANTKEVVQRVKAHEGVVLWVDTCPKLPGRLVTCGLDGKVLIWTDGDEELEEQDELEEPIAAVNGVKVEQNDEMDGVLLNSALEHGVDDTPKREESNGVDHINDHSQDADKMVN